MVSCPELKPAIHQFGSWPSGLGGSGTSRSSALATHRGYERLSTRAAYAWWSAGCLRPEQLRDGRAERFAHLPDGEPQARCRFRQRRTRRVAQTVVEPDRVTRPRRKHLKCCWVERVKLLGQAARSARVVDKRFSTDTWAELREGSIGIRHQGRSRVDVGKYWSTRSAVNVRYQLRPPCGHS
jgi:hypothetical protein